MASFSPYGVASRVKSCLYVNQITVKKMAITSNFLAYILLYLVFLFVQQHLGSHHVVQAAHWDEKLSLQTILDDLRSIIPGNEFMKDILDIHNDVLQLVDMKRYSFGSSRR